MRYFLDTEFNGMGGELISLALVAEDGRELYAACHCEEPIPWVKENVIPIVFSDMAKPMIVRPQDFGRAIEQFLIQDGLPEIVADWPDDIRYFCEKLITGPGEMVDVHRLRFRIERVDAYPTDLAGAVQHNALWDARALKHRLLGQII